MKDRVQCTHKMAQNPTKTEAKSKPSTHATKKNKIKKYKCRIREVACNSED